MKSRLYKVLIEGTIHLVEASTQAQAIAHVAKGHMTCEVASAIEATKLSLAGVVVEQSEYCCCRAA